MPNIIYIDASTKYSFCGLLRGNSFEHKIVHDKLNEHSKVLHLHIEEILKNAQLEFKNIDALAVMNGPGSYTGLRTALATAKGICFSLDIPLILLNKVELLLTQNSAKHTKDCCILLPAREDEFFFAAYDAENDKHYKAKHIFRDDFIEHEEVFRGKIYGNSSSEKLDINIIESVLAENCIENAINQRFKDKNFDNIIEAVPFYLKGVHIHK